MNNEELQNILDKHKLWLNEKDGGERARLICADLQGANLQGANLWYADLREANLREANIDFSSFPLWCGTKGVVVDKRIARQIAAHFCAFDCDDPEYQAARQAILEFARGSHRAKELGL